MKKSDSQSQTTPAEKIRFIIVLLIIVAIVLLLVTGMFAFFTKIYVTP